MGSGVSRSGIADLEARSSTVRPNYGPGSRWVSNTKQNKRGLKHQAAGASSSTAVNVTGLDAPLRLQAASTAAGVPSMTMPSCLNA